MKTLAWAFGLAMLFAPAAMAQTHDELVKGATDTNNVLNHGMGYNLQRFSPLKQINKDTIKRLVPVWNYSFDDNRSEESQPLVYKGVLYVTTNSATMAIDAKTGKQIWKTKVEYPPETPRIVCCGIINRGAAIYDGKIFRTTLDANVIALDAKTGKELWRQKAADIKEGYSMTVAPLIADNVLITGISCFRFEGDHIAQYRETFDTGIALTQLGFPAERLKRVLDKEAAAQNATIEAREHLARFNQA